VLEELDDVGWSVLEHALAWFPEDAAGSLPALLAATVPEGDDDVSLAAAATALVALGMGGRGTGREPDGEAVAAAATALADERELLRWGAAVALAGLRGPEADREAVAELLTWAGGPAAALDGIPFLDGDVAGLAVLALRHLGESYAEATFDALLGRLRSVSGPQAVTVTAEALRRAWPDGRPIAVAESTPFSALTDPQQRLLRALADSPDTWSYLGYGVFGNLSLLLSGHGLPRDVEQMRAYVGGRP
jgi:hypothetical protein